MTIKNLFITATDTDAGKTYIATAIVRQLVAKGKKVAVYKPISAGCEQIKGELINEDAALLLAASNAGQGYHEVNPIKFKEAIAPHIAAKLHNKAIDEDLILAGFYALAGDINIVEGAGGWRLPLGNGRFLSDFVKQSQCHVLLVVNMKLGCLNHAVLTYQSIIADGLTCLGWIANNQENMPYLNENIAELASLISAPLLAVVNPKQELADISQALT